MKCTAARIVPRQDLEKISSEAHNGDKTIVFTNGCFDLLHLGHVRYLKEASSFGDLLVVGVNSDTSMIQIKGEKRPVVPDTERAEIVAALVWIDYVTIFEEPDPLKLIELIRPDVLVKGSDWQENEIIGADFVRSYGGKVVRIPLIPKRSTTAIIETIVKRFTST